MIIRYISLHMNNGSGYEDKFRNQFNLNSRFVSNYLSVQVRKLKIETDGTFNMISVIPTLNITENYRIVSEKTLRASIPFNREIYIKMNQIERYEYYLKMLEDGYNVCVEHKQIPIKQLLMLHENFRNNNYKNEWLHKKKKFKDYNLDVILKCYFTYDSFQLKITVNDLKTKEELMTGIVIQTLPDEVCFQPLFKDIVIHNDYLAITEFQDRDKFIFALEDIYAKKFKFKVTDVGLMYKSISANFK